MNSKKFIISILLGPRPNKHIASEIRIALQQHKYIKLANDLSLRIIILLWGI